MNALDHLLWTAVVFVLLRTMRAVTVRQQYRRWLAFGLLLGLGLLNKYSIGLLILGLLVGCLLTERRALFKERWPWLAAGAALLVFLPHLLWQLAQGFPTLEFIHNAAFYKNTPPGVFTLLAESLLHLTPVGFLLLVAACVHGFSKSGRPRRFLVWVYPVAFALTALGGKTYYLAPVFLILVPLGAVAFEGWAARGWRWLRYTVPVLFALLSLASLPPALPVLSPQRSADYAAALGLVPQLGLQRAEVLPQYFADRFGWPELVETLAVVHGSLTPAQRADCGVFCTNYGQAGAVVHFAPAYGLPPATCPHNSYWHWGPPPTHRTWIVVGALAAELKELFADVELKTNFSHPWVMDYEDDKPIWLCSEPLADLAELWPELRFYL